MIACLPAVRPGCAKISKKLLLWLSFVHCTMVIPFILYYPSLFFCIPLNKASSCPTVISCSMYSFVLLVGQLGWSFFSMVRQVGCLLRFCPVIYCYSYYIYLSLVQKSMSFKGLSTTFEGLMNVYCKTNLLTVNFIHNDIIKVKHGVISGGL